MTQDEALNILKLGRNVFLTGSAGSGKTYLLNRYITYLRHHKIGVSVTASTGLAATHLDGRTIHSWSGIGIRDSITDGQLNNLQRDKRLRKRYLKTKILIIDEISMLHAYQLDLIDKVARHMLQPLLPFGGLQVVLCGDFFQLPPVAFESISGTKFAFESIAWTTADLCTCYLHEQHRQGNDPLFSVLNDIRSGNAGEHTKVPLRTRYKKETVGKVQATKLYARKINVDKINEVELDALSGAEKVFNMTAQGSGPILEALIRNCPAQKELRLKVGTKVMFVKNASDGSYVNGTLGVVQSFDADDMPLIQTFDGRTVTAETDNWKFEENDIVQATITQVPLKLAWAITIHKSQGMTLDAAEMDLSDAFEPGMGYVALSRVRSLSGLNLLGLNDTALSVNPGVLHKDHEFQQQSQMATEQLRTVFRSELTSLQTETLLERFEGKLRESKRIPELQSCDTQSASIGVGESIPIIDDKQKNAYEPWTVADDEVLAALIADNQPLQEIASKLYRGRGAIRSRLKKLDLELSTGKVQRRAPVVSADSSNGLSDTYNQTRKLLLEQQHLTDIAQERNLVVSTILSHMEHLKSKNRLPDIRYLSAKIDNFGEILDLFKQAESQHLSPIHEHLQGIVSYETLRMVRLYLEDSD